MSGTATNRTNITLPAEMSREILAKMQTESAVKGIYYLCNAIPVICFTLCLIGIGLVYNLDKAKTDQMYAEMEARRAAAHQ